MNIKSVIVTGLVLFVAVFGIEFLIHGMWLSGIYNQTAEVWRPKADMRHFMPFMTAAQFIFAMVFTALFARGYESTKPGLGQGFRFGIWAACLLSPANALMWYAILPIPALLAVFWFLGCFGEILLMGILAGLIYRAK